jgi:type VII secretion-associated serine protease mycosin
VLSRTAPIRRALARVTAVLAALLVLTPVLCGAVPYGGADGLLAATAYADQVRGSQEEVLRTLDVERAWRITRGKGVLVAVLDSGVDPRHRDLVGSVITGRDFTVGANPPGVPPKRLHGTYMASLIAGHGHGPGRRNGVIGVAPEAKILSVRVILEDEEPGFRAFNSEPRFEKVVARGIRYAVDRGAHVINMSISKDQPTRAERAAIRYAISKGVVLVAAAGNEGAGKRNAPYSYPASLPGVISVAAADKSQRRASFSNRNSLVTVAAPGVDVLGAGPGDEYWIGRGTSQATALVSGVAALIKSRYPKMSPALVAQAITAGARGRPAGGYDPGTGFGVVNAALALRHAALLARHRHVASGPGVQDPEKPIRPETGVPTVSTGPIRVVHRDRGKIALYGGIAVAAGIGSLACFFVMLVLIRRMRRKEHRLPQEIPEPQRPALST